MSDTDTITHEDVEGAAAELAQLTGSTYADIMDAIHEAAGGERDEVALTMGLAEVVSALREAGVDLPEPQEELVSGRGMLQVTAPDDYPVAASRLAYSQPDYEADMLALTHQHDVALARQEHVELPSGHVVSGPDGYLVGLCHRNPAARKHFRPSPQTEQILRASGYAVGEDDDPDADEDESLYADVPGAGGPAAILARARNSGLLQRPAAATAEGGRGKHRKNCPPGCNRDHGVHPKGGVIHPEVQRLMDNHPGLLGEQLGGEHPYGNSQRIPA